MSYKKVKLVNSELEYIRFVGECLSGWKDAENYPDNIKRLKECFGAPNMFPVKVVFDMVLEEGDSMDYMMPIFGIEQQRVQTYIQKFK